MIGVLGPVQVVTSGVTSSLPGVTQRRLLAILSLHAPEPVRTERLAELLEVSPSGLRTTVTRLRRLLGDDAVTSTAGGYRLTADVDAHVFCKELAAPAIASAPDLETRLRALERALALWRGPAFDEFAHEEWAAGEAARLNELHAAATEDRVEGLVEAGRCSEAIAELSDAHRPSPAARPTARPAHAGPGGRRSTGRRAANPSRVPPPPRRRGRYGAFGSGAVDRAAHRRRVDGDVGRCRRRRGAPRWPADATGDGPLRAVRRTSRDCRRARRRAGESVPGACSSSPASRASARPACSPSSPTGCTAPGGHVVVARGDEDFVVELPTVDRAARTARASR